MAKVRLPASRNRILPRPWSRANISFPPKRTTILPSSPSQEATTALDDERGSQLSVRGQGMWETIQPKLQLQGAPGDTRAKPGLSLPLPGSRLHQEVCSQNRSPETSSECALEGAQPQVRLLRPSVCQERYSAKVSPSSLSFKRPHPFILSDTNACPSLQTGTWKMVAPNASTSAPWISDQRPTTASHDLLPLAP